jgi:hypothetical protein
MENEEPVTSETLPNANTSTNGETPYISEVPPIEKTPSSHRYDYNLKVGQSDRNGKKIEYIYACVPGVYCIYHIDKYDIQIIAEDEGSMTKDAEVNKLLLTVGDYFANDYKVRTKYISYMAYAVKTFYDDNKKNARQALTLTHENILRYLERKAEFAYLTGAFLMVLISLLTYFVVYKVGDLSDLGHIIFCAISFSAIGGLLSVSTSSGNIKVDVQNPFRTKVFYGATRIMIAIISGVIAYFLVDSKILFAFIKDTNNIHAFYVVFFLAGFSEKLIPNIMLDFDKTKSSTNTKPDTNNNS